MPSLYHTYPTIKGLIKIKTNIEFSWKKETLNGL